MVRGGFGIFYPIVSAAAEFVHAVEQGDPYALTLDFAGPAGAPYGLASPFPSTPLGFTPRWFNPATGANSALNSPFYAAVHTPLTRQYNLNLQYQLAPSWVLEVGFVGSSGINQTDYNHDYNVAQLVKYCGRNNPGERRLPRAVPRLCAARVTGNRLRPGLQLQQPPGDSAEAIFLRAHHAGGLPHRRSGPHQY